MTLADLDRAFPGTRILLLGLFVLGALLPTGGASAQTIHRRDGAEPISAVRIVLQPDGVLCTRESGADRLVLWDQVRSIENIDDPSLRDAWERQQPIAEDLWRARDRVQRGDARLAEPLLEKHFDRMIRDWGDSELMLIVAEGLLRARLARGEIEHAMPAALEVIRLRRAGVTTDRYAQDDLPEVVDETHWLVPALPPIVTSVEKTGALPRQLQSWLDAEDPYVRALASGYASRSGSERASDAATGPGLVVMGAALDSLDASSEQREQARLRLEALASEESAPPWIDAWSRWFKGRSLLEEQDPDIDGALIELLHLPARHLKRSPALASRAVALSADVLEQVDRHAEAALLRRELLVSQANVPPVESFELHMPDQTAESENP